MEINNDQLKKFKEALADIIVSSQGLCTYDACKDVAEREATFLISMLLPEPNIQSSNIKETIRAEIERRMDKHWDLLPDADSPEDDWTHNELCELGAFKELEYLETFLDTLPEQPVEYPTSTEMIAEWENNELPLLRDKDFRGDAERMAYNAFMDGFAKGLGYKK